MNPIDSFFEHIRKQHPDPDSFVDFIAACKRPLRKSIRVNTLKISVDDFKGLAAKRGWILTPIPWCKEGFWIDHNPEKEPLQLGNCGEHLMGLFYIQEASSMLPAEALLSGLSTEPNGLDANKMVLDMAAAPGSKTTQLAAIMSNEGTLLANELSASRLKVLHANLQRCGVTNACMSHLDGTLLDKRLSGCFDAILLDAPCGGEGTYRKDPKALDNWSLNAIETISQVQKQLLLAAWKMLKPGGRMIYSTCTLSREENQQVIESLQSDILSEMTIVSLAALFPEALFPEAKRAITKEGFLQVWPEIFDCEGFFVACIEKSTSAIVESAPVLQNQSPFKPLTGKTITLIEDYYQQHFGFDMSDLSNRLRIRDSHHEQQIWLFPEQGDRLRQALKLQRSGIRICDLISSRQGPLIKTQHEFVISYGNALKSQTVELDSCQAESCCRGENIQLQEADQLKKGEVVMLYQGYPLGLAKALPAQKKQQQKITLKNNLPRDLLRSNADFL
ncbi:MAG: 16S rRNA (cytosine(1407)-C(5))-methyltransferase RsmF [Gammaproteobacteria bacterium]|nr:MAG: 16S rRNA (cytosine(1407)-C(5))-methyltransferase RsmF [Gammaproteobacteria bacterium]